MKKRVKSYLTGSIITILFSAMMGGAAWAGLLFDQYAVEVNHDTATIFIKNPAENGVSADEYALIVYAGYSSESSDEEVWVEFARRKYYPEDLSETNRKEVLISHFPEGTGLYCELYGKTQDEGWNCIDSSDKKSGENTQAMIALDPGFWQARETSPYLEDDEEAELSFSLTGENDSTDSLYIWFDSRAMKLDDASELYDLTTSSDETDAEGNQVLSLHAPKDIFSKYPMILSGKEGNEGEIPWISLEICGEPLEKEETSEASSEVLSETETGTLNETDDKKDETQKNGKQYFLMKQPLQEEETSVESEEEQTNRELQSEGDGAISETIKAEKTSETEEQSEKSSELSSENAAENKDHTSHSEKEKTNEEVTANEADGEEFAKSEKTSDEDEAKTDEKPVEAASMSDEPAAGEEAGNEEAADEEAAGRDETPVKEKDKNLGQVVDEAAGNEKADDDIAENLAQTNRKQDKKTETSAEEADAKAEEADAKADMSAEKTDLTSETAATEETESETAATEETESGTAATEEDESETAVTEEETESEAAATEETDSEMTPETEDVERHHLIPLFEGMNMLQMLCVTGLLLAVFVLLAVYRKGSYIEEKKRFQPLPANEDDETTLTGGR